MYNFNGNTSADLGVKQPSKGCYLTVEECNVITDAEDASVIPSQPLNFTIFCIHNNSQERKDTTPFLIVIDSEKRQAFAQLKEACSLREHKKH